MMAAMRPVDGRPAGGGSHPGLRLLQKAPEPSVCGGTGLTWAEALNLSTTIWMPAVHAAVPRTSEPGEHLLPPPLNNHRGPAMQQLRTEVRLLSPRHCFFTSAPLPSVDTSEEETLRQRQLNHGPPSRYEPGNQ
ncbi:unnamed protein product [Boreogadus saida]